MEEKTGFANKIKWERLFHINLHAHIKHELQAWLFPGCKSTCATGTKPNLQHTFEVSSQVYWRRTVDRRKYFKNKYFKNKYFI